MVEVLTASFLPQEASLSVQPAVEVKHSRFYCYGSESDDSDKSICSSVMARDGENSICVMGFCFELINSVF